MHIEVNVDLGVATRSEVLACAIRPPAHGAPAQRDEELHGLRLPAAPRVEPLHRPLTRPLRR
jgi:hypothetical protein